MTTIQQNRKTAKPKKELIFLKAAELFRDKGYVATSMRDIARSVNLEVSSLYSHISSKDDLLQKICFDCAREFTQGLIEIKENKESPLEQLEALICLHVAVAKSDPTSITVFNDEWKHLKDPFLMEFLQMRKEYEQSFARIIERAIEQKKIRACEPEIILNSVLSLTKWIQPGTARTDKWKEEHLAKEICNLILHGLQLK